MIVFYIVFALVIIKSLSYKRKGYNFHYIHKNECDAIKGIFILLVFLSHVTPYLKHAGFAGDYWLDTSFMALSSKIGQWVVALFLFYSGFGVMHSLKNNGKMYLNRYPQKRILTTLLNFDVAVLAFLLLDIVLGIDVISSNILGAFIGWNSVGNSNWYIFVVLICYACFYGAFRIGNNHRIGGVFLLLILFVVMILLSCIKEYRWYNTILCFPAGVWFSIKQDLVEKYMQINYWKLLIISFLAFGVFCYLDLPRFCGLTYNLGCVSFSVMIVLLTMKFSVNSSVLRWCGINLFPIYIYQRIPMIAISHIAGESWLVHYPFFYILICLFVTILIAYYYRYWKVILA